jgi:hypothetical protein
MVAESRQGKPPRPSLRLFNYRGLSLLDHAFALLGFALAVHT